jgi:exopolysaccharide biosynthesis WecB/TagA/CpsF family protein
MSFLGLESRELFVEPTGAQAKLARSLLGAAKPASALWGGSTVKTRKVSLFGFSIDNTPLTAAASDLAKAARDGRRTRVVFVNAHAANTAMADPGYHATVAAADRIYADGSGMAVAARMAGQQLADNVNGTDLFPVLCREAISAETRIFLLGGRPGVAAKAAQTVADFGMVDAIAGTHHGYFTRGGQEEREVIAKINASGAGILLIGFGVPLQDQWAERHAPSLKTPVIAGVGGLFDFFSGAVSRSPKFMRTIGCEWMWRLALEPRRMAYRYLIGNAIFLGHSARLVVRDRWVRRGQPSTVPRIGQNAAT